MSTHKRRVTEERLAANRAAAARSTGPRTPDGKQRAAFNSFKHGLYASQDSVIRQAFTRAGLHSIDAASAAYPPKSTRVPYSTCMLSAHSLRLPMTGVTQA